MEAGAVVLVLGLISVTLMMVMGLFLINRFKLHFALGPAVEDHLIDSGEDLESFLQAMMLNPSSEEAPF